MYHEVELIGFLGKDPEMRFTQSGVPVTSFSVATSNKYTNGAGEKVDETTWWKITAWRKLAETVNQYLSKGAKVFVKGTMVVDKKTGGPKVWTGRDGSPRASLEVDAFTVKFLDSRGSGSPRDEDVPQEAF